MNDLEKKSIECIKNMPIEETTYQVARNVVLDYITELQEELETKQYDINNLTYQLAKEIEENKYLDELRNANYLSWQDSLSRLEKAVEYIKEHSNSFSVLDTISNGTLLNILKGENNEQ